MEKKEGFLSDKCDSDSDEQDQESNIQKGTELIKSQLRNLPQKPGVYRMLDEKGTVLYVGKALNLKKRVLNYTKPERISQRILRMVSETRKLEIVTTHTEVEALLLESNLIKQFRPRFNVLLRDDKSFAHIFISSDDAWPILIKHRGSQKRPGSYFGPYASAGAVNRSLTALQKAFLLRNCSDNVFKNRTRPCLQYQIKRCSAPCVDYVTNSEYLDLVDQARSFLSGDTVSVQKKLSVRMEKASENQDYESAAIYRDRIHALTQIQSKQDINVKGVSDADVIALHTQQGFSCIQVFFFRAGSNLGNRAYFPRHHRMDDQASILEAFLGQFYENKRAPRRLLLSHNINNSKLLSEALTVRSNGTVKLIIPSRGDLKKLVLHAQENAKEALARNRAMQTSQLSLLKRLADLFCLPKPPERIEVYDNSHIQGTNAVGAMIVAGSEGFEKKSYRKFNIRDEIVEPHNKQQSGSNPIPGNSKSIGAAGDDYFMMRQVLKRRFAKVASSIADGQKAVIPDLVVIDGGAGHLSASLDVAEELKLGNICFVAIAKGPDRNAGREVFYQPGKKAFSLQPNDPLLHYLQRLRDEAHRFAIETHRARRFKAMTRSVLDDIPAVGPKRKKDLLFHFGSARAVARAGLRDLEQVDGISRNLAKQIYDYFHEH